MSSNLFFYLSARGADGLRLRGYQETTVFRRYVTKSTGCVHVRRLYGGVFRRRTEKPPVMMSLSHFTKSEEGNKQRKDLC